MDIVVNVVIVTCIVCFVLGLIVGMLKNGLKIFAVLGFIGAWAFAKFAPGMTSLSAAGSGGFFTFYMQWFDRMSSEQQEAVYFAPIAFAVGFLLFRFYKMFIYKEKIETPQERKRRVISEYTSN